MKLPVKIYEDQSVINYLINRWLTKQYISACQKLISWSWSTDFKNRQPKSSWIWSFRINKQFRAIGYFRWGDFIVVEVDNHQ